MWIKPWWITLKGLNPVLSFRLKPARLNTCQPTMGSEGNRCASDWKHCLPGFGKTDVGERAAKHIHTAPSGSSHCIFLPSTWRENHAKKKGILSHIMRCIIQLLSHNSVAELPAPPLFFFLLLWAVIFRSQLVLRFQPPPFIFSSIHTSIRPPVHPLP